MTNPKPMQLIDTARHGRCVTLSDALRFAEERVAHALELVHGGFTALEIQLANEAFTAHHLSRRASRGGQGSGDARSSGVDSVAGSHLDLPPCPPLAGTHPHDPGDEAANAWLPTA